MRNVVVTFQLNYFKILLLIGILLVFPALGVYAQSDNDDLTSQGGNYPALFEKMMPFILESTELTPEEIQYATELNEKNSLGENISASEMVKFTEIYLKAKGEGLEQEGGGCLIATATFGTELAPQVQHLRELRDNSLLETNSGTSFMSGFNQFYYSFSPTIADWERHSPVFKEIMKIAIMPLLTSLSILNYVDMDTEAKVLGYGISLILLNVGMYIVAPVGIGLVLVRKWV